MRQIPQALRKELEADPMMHVCIHDNDDCRDEYGRRPARAEWEHAFVYAGKQVSEWWAIIGVCWYHHRGPGLNKDYNRFRCLRRLTSGQIKEISEKYPRFDWSAERARLMKKFPHE